MNVRTILFIAALAPILSLGGCVLGHHNATKSAKVLLEQNGMTDVQMTGLRWFGCGSEDTFRSGFSAKAANGSETSGVVCSGWFKGKTIRFD